MAIVYILYSKTIEKYYVGSCSDFVQRIDQHRNKTFIGFTNRSDDWEVYLKIENLEYQKARKIETHIKKMKSKKYIENLQKFPEMIEKLKKI